LETVNTTSTPDKKEKTPVSQKAKPTTIPTPSKPAPATKGNVAKPVEKRTDTKAVDKPVVVAKKPAEAKKPTKPIEHEKKVQEEKQKPDVKVEPTPAIEPKKPEELFQLLRLYEKEEIVYLKLSELHPFKDHPFGIRNDDEMKSLVESVKDNGVNTPALVRPLESGGYEIVAGHRRHKASGRAGLTVLPCIVREMTDQEAVLTMTDDNLQQRTEILPSERAKSLKMQFEAIKHQGVRFKGIASGDVGKRSSELVGDRNNMNSKQVQRYIRLNELEPDLIKAVDEKKLGFVSAVEISFISKKNQNLIAISIDGQQSSPSLSQAQRMRELDQKKMLNGDVIDGILCEQKKEVDKVIITSDELSKYFGREKTPREMKDQIIKLLDAWSDKEKAKTTPEKNTPDRSK